MNLSVEDAKTLSLVISAIVIPFAVTWLKSVTWPDALKFALAVFLSLIAAGLTAYVAGQIVFTGSLIQNAAVIFSGAQIVYYAAFRTLGLERVLFPQDALVNKAQGEVAQQVSDQVSTNAAAKDILDESTPPTLNVSTSISNEK